MRRERTPGAVVLAAVLLFAAAVNSLVMSLWQSIQAPYEAVLFSLYVTLGIFLLLAAGNRSANRTFVGFTPWSNFAYGAGVAVETLGDGGKRRLGAVPGPVALLARSGARLRSCHSSSLASNSY